MKPDCTVPSCVNEAWEAGLCHAHYSRRRTHGDVYAHVAIGDWKEPSPARALRTVEIKTFPRFNDDELAQFLQIPFVGTCS